MDISEFIGFIVSLAALLFLFIRSLVRARYRRQHPEEAALDDKKQRETLKNFLKSLDVDTEELDDEEEELEKERIHSLPRREPPPAPQFEPPGIQKKKEEERWQTAIEERRLQTTLEKRRLESLVEQRRLETLVEKRRLETSVESRHAPKMESAIEKDAYQERLHLTSTPSRAQQLLSEKRTKKEMILLQEILNPPKGLRSERF